LSFRLIINADVPNNPVRRGISGWFIGMFKEENPKKPERRKTIRLVRIYFSLRIKYDEINISKMGRAK